METPFGEPNDGQSRRDSRRAGKTNRAARAWRKEHSDKVDLSVYEIPRVAASGSRLT